jgi:hypothetical protein
MEQGDSPLMNFHRVPAALSCEAAAAEKIIRIDKKRLQQPSPEAVRPKNHPDR